jgi:tRNA threonylcarbamoyladenosine biosynthesis protein TsaE
MFKFISHAENETIDFACKLASKLNNGDLIVLSGNLGSGKTKFTQGILKYFGLEDEISSPTFTIVNEHHSGSINIYHFDVYRLQDVDEFYAIGGEEYLNKGICIIEWGEIIESILPTDYIKVNFERDLENDNNRIIDIEVHGDRLLPTVKEVFESENT